MKRILIISFYCPPDLSAGSFRTGALIEALIPTAEINKVKIDIMTTYPNRYDNYHVEAQHQETSGPVTIHRIKIPAHQGGFFDQAKAYVHYFLYCSRMTKKEKYDVVYAVSGRLFSAFLGARIATRERIPLFLDIRDIFTDTMASILKFPLTLLLPIFYLIERYSIKKARALNLVSPGFLSYFKVNKHCIVSSISNGVDNCFHGIDYHHQKNNNQIKRVVYAGNFGKGQALEKIIPALANATKDRCEFYIIGSGGQKKELEKKCAGLKNVKIFPPVDRKTLIQRYIESDILFLHLDHLPAFDKVLPSKIFEYAVTGKPILAGISGYSAHFVNEYVLGSWIFPPCDTVEAVKQLNSILNAPQYYDRNVFYEKFNREKLMHELATRIMSFV